MMAIDLSGKTAFITGAAQGLGLAIAQAMHSVGARVVLTDINEAVHGAAATLSTDTETVLSRQLDVNDVEAFRKVFLEYASETDGIDILVNNAGLTVMKDIWDIQVEEWDQVLGINLRSVFFGCQFAGKHMRGRGWGRIINLSSIAGQQASLVAGAHYAASKAGIISVTKNFAQVLAGEGVTVNAIAPAAIHTPIMDTIPPEKIEALKQKIPVGRVGKPTEIAGVAVYLASAEAGFITGATIDANGGVFMR